MPLYMACLFSMPWNDDTVAIEKPDGIHSPNFVEDDFSELFLHASIVSVKHSRPA